MAAEIEREPGQLAGAKAVVDPQEVQHAVDQETTAVLQRVFLRQRSEELRKEAVARSGDPQARASLVIPKGSVVSDQLPGGKHANLGKATWDRVKREHLWRAVDDPMRPAGKEQRNSEPDQPGI